MKICLISFDYWGLDRHISDSLRKRSIDCHHIDISKFSYSYPTFWHRIGNFFSKLLLRRNIKHVKRDRYILDQLAAIGKQDVILVIRPDLISEKTHRIIKGMTANYYAYLYDSMKRFKVGSKLAGFFDEIYSFDEKDANRYNFNHITNYIYNDGPLEPAVPGKTNPPHPFKVFFVMSVKDRGRVELLNQIATQLEHLNISFKFIVVGKKRPKTLHPAIEFSTQNVSANELMEHIQEAEVLLDLVRAEQTGLSFRIFEALGAEKKIITNNPSVRKYDFYNGNNILLIKDAADIGRNARFFTNRYLPVDEEIYSKYTIDHWVKTVFELVDSE